MKSIIYLYYLNNKNNNCTILHILHSPSYILLIFNLLCLYANKTKRQDNIDHKLLITKLQINDYNPSCDLKNYVLHSLDIKFSFFPNRECRENIKSQKIYDIITPCIAIFPSRDTPTLKSGSITAIKRLLLGELGRVNSYRSLIWLITFALKTLID